MTTIIDYGAGNLASVAKAFRHIGCEVRISGDPDEIAHARRLVLPGVGNFAATTVLERKGLKQAISEAVAAGSPFLGICLGMQWLCDGSTEAPSLKGLGAFPGSCERFSGNVKTPHVGWNSIEVVSESRLLRGVRTGEFMYFAHSYRALPGPGTVAVSMHGGPFAAAMERDNLFGVQFHPEKSAAAGLNMLRNFAGLPC